MVHEYTEFFNVEAAIQAGLEPAKYINLDKLQAMVGILLKQHEYAPSRFRTDVSKFGIRGVVFLARFLNYHLRPEQPLQIPDKF
jgi:hypothetical protein